MLYTLRIQQKVSTKSPIAPYLLELEYEYLRTNLIERLAGLNLNKDLQGLTNDLQQLIDGTKFTINKEAKSIVQETNKVVDKIIENIQKGQRLTGGPIVTGKQIGRAHV